MFGVMPKGCHVRIWVYICMSMSKDDTVNNAQPSVDPAVDTEAVEDLTENVIAEAAQIAKDAVDNPIVDVAIDQGAQVAQGLASAGIDLKTAIEEGDLSSTGTAIGAAGNAIGPLGAIPTKNAAKAVSIAQRAVAAGARVTNSVGAVKGLRQQRNAKKLTEALVGQSEDQGNVVCEFTCGSESWVVASVKLRDKLDECIEGEVFVQNESSTTDPRSILGQPCQLKFDREGQALTYPLVVTSVEHAGQGDSWSMCRLTVADPLYLARLGRNSRIFQKATLRQIVSEVIESGLADFDVALEMSFKDEDHPTYEYKTQYDESDYAFVRRLFSENGISYWYELKDGAATFLVHDNPQTNQNFPKIESDNGSKIEVSSYRASDGGRECILSFSRHTNVRNNKITVRARDWTRPRTAFKEEASAEHSDDATKGAIEGGSREHYFHGTAPVNFFDYNQDERAYLKDELSRQTKLRHEQLGATTSTAKGRGTVTGFGAGRMFKLDDRENPEANDEYLLIEVTHSYERKSTYTNSFVCTPTSSPYRCPALGKKPRVYGVETATVIGPSDQEIHTDEHGRVKVRFHWDRREELDNKQGEQEEPRSEPYASCFIRCMQPWAGNGWGFSFVPRINMEVVVSFVHGDPDRPIISGSLYNGDNVKAYQPSKDLTKSTLRTRSSVGGEEERWKKSVSDVGYNELTFEDKDGQEEVFIRAQKDLREVVQHNHATSVGADRTITVEGTRTENVTKAEDVKLHNTYDLTVAKKMTETYNDGRMTTVETYDAETVNTGNKTVEVVAGQYNVMSAEQLKLTQAGEHYVRLEKVIELSTTTDFNIHNKQVAVKTETGKLTLMAKDEITLQCGQSSITLTSDGKISIHGPLEVNMGSGNTSIKTDPSSVQTSAAKISSGAIGDHTITGGLVKIN